MLISTREQKEPALTTINSFSPDSGIAGDGITKTGTLTLTGTAAADSAVKVNDGATLLGSATANSSGIWNYATGALSDGPHSFTAGAGGGTGGTASAFPDASTTGVPLGIVLTSVNGDFTSSQSGQVIDGLDVKGTIIFNNPGVTIKNCQAQYIILNANNITIEDSTIVGNNTEWPNGIDIEADYATVLRVDISGVENGIWLEGNNALIKDNYLHDFLFPTISKEILVSTDCRYRAEAVPCLIT